MDFEKGTQIIYMPNHVCGNIDHEDCEEGFIADPTIRHGHVFCRYWSSFDPEALRTKANSESTPAMCLRIKQTRPQHLVDEVIERYNI